MPQAKNNKTKQVKNNNTKQIKEDLKTIVNLWSEIEDQREYSIYDINDTTAKWDKNLEISDIESLAQKQLGPKPLKLDETEPKEPRYKYPFERIILFLFGIIMIYSVATFFVNDYIDLAFQHCIANIVCIIMNVGIFIIIRRVLQYREYTLKSKLEAYEPINQQNKTTDKKEKKVTDSISILGIVLVSVFGLIWFGYVIYLLIICITTQTDKFALIFEIIMITLYLVMQTLTALTLVTGHKYKISDIEYKAYLHKYECNKEYNNSQYLVEIKEWNNKFQLLSQDLLKKANVAHKKIAENYKQIEKIDIISTTQAKYAQYLLDYIYKGAETIKEAFEMLEKNKAEINSQIASKYSINKVNGTQTWQKPKWEDLSEEEQKPYIIRNIEILYNIQLSDTDSTLFTLTRQQRALKQVCLDKNEFYIEDLNEEEKESVLEMAIHDYNSQEEKEVKNYDLVEFEPYIPRFVKRWYKMILSTPQLRHELTAREIEIYNEKLRNKDFKLEDLDQEAKEFVLEQIDKSIKYKEQYRTSTRHKLSLTQIILCVIGAIGFILNLILQMAAKLSSDSAIILIVCAITVACPIASLLISIPKSRYCKRCGTRGYITNSDSESHYEIDRQLVPQYQNTLFINDAHLSYDKEGRAFAERLVHKTTTTDHFECPCCGQIWTRKTTSKN